MQRLEGSVKEYMMEKNMIRPGDHVLAGVSGGADSVCLIRILAALRKELGLTLTAVHVEHGIRGEESLADMDFVRDLCKELGVDCVCRQVDAAGAAKERHLTLEEAARLLRYEAFDEAAAETGADRIALAHHLEDDAETILFHLARGSGLQGLTGIPAVRGRIIRPLLKTSREEIEAYLDAAGQSWRQDRTNEDLYYARNRIRARVLPELEEINAGAARHLTQTADRLRTVWSFLEEMTDEAAARIVTRTEEGFLVDTEGFRGLHEAVRDRLVHRLLEEAAGSKKDLGAVHIAIVRDLLLGQSGRAADLPYGLRAEAEQGRLRLYRTEGGRKGPEAPAFADGQSTSAGPDFADRDMSIPGDPALCDGQKAPENAACPIDPEGRNCLPDGKIMACRRFEFRGGLEKIPVKTYTKWFDYDKIKDRLCVRSRQSGDYLVINDAGDRKRLKNWMIDEKIPASERGRCLLLADGSHILWVIGSRISSFYKVSENTRVVLEVRVYSEEESNA